MFIILSSLRSIIDSVGSSETVFVSELEDAGSEQINTSEDNSDTGEDDEPHVPSEAVVTNPEVTFIFIVLLGGLAVISSSLLGAIIEELVISFLW